MNPIALVLTLVALVAAVAATVAWRRALVQVETQRARAERALTEGVGAVAERQILLDQIAHERESHAQALANLQDTFEALSQRTLVATVEHNNKANEQVVIAREKALEARLEPLETLLARFREETAKIEAERVSALEKVNQSAQILRDEQGKALAEAQRLNHILGRSDHRGAWGEFQLARILEMSGLTQHISYVTQQTSNDQRPDVLVTMPNGATVVIDSKMPLAAYDDALAADNETVRAAKMTEHAAALRGHIKALNQKAYWKNYEEHSPQFVICFVPSDQLLTSALVDDPRLLEQSYDAKVLLAGPTTLLAALWSIASGWQRTDIAEAAEEIRSLATELADRVVVALGHIKKVGDNLKNATDNYNSFIGSVESRVVPTVRRVRELKLITAELPDVGPVTVVPRSVAGALETEAPEALTAQVVEELGPTT
jgi:DNA recombination protein RmuC